MHKIKSNQIKIILKMWSGLGYNNRAIRLYESSKLIAEKGFKNIYPNFELLPGVGQYTKNAILSFAYGDKVLALDTNLERVLTRYFAIDSTKNYVRKYSDFLLAGVNSRDLNQALMDLGSSICTNSNPKCDICPLEKKCEKYILKSKISIVALHISFEVAKPNWPLFIPGFPNFILLPSSKFFWTLSFTFTGIFLESVFL